MNTVESYLDLDGLTHVLNQHYDLRITHIHLHREMIGHVYIAASDTRKYVLKLYRPFHSEQALQSVQIIKFLAAHDYPVVSIIPTESDEQYVWFHITGKRCIGVLFQYAGGEEPDIDQDIVEIGEQIAQLHGVMEKYEHPLLRRGKDFYIDRCTRILKAVGYERSKTRCLEQYGELLWESMQDLPLGFCHGDLHSGNMLKNDVGKYVLFDFDVAGQAAAMIDAATLSDATNFNRLDPLAYNKTLARFERFYRGYSRHRTLSVQEVEAIFSFIAIRHYELIATITECQGLESLDSAFLDEQTNWLLAWEQLSNTSSLDLSRCCPVNKNCN